MCYSCVDDVSTTDALDQNVLYVFLWSGKRLISDAY